VAARSAALVTSPVKAGVFCRWTCAEESSGAYPFASPLFATFSAVYPSERSPPGASRRPAFRRLRLSESRSPRRGRRDLVAAAFWVRRGVRRRGERGRFSRQRAQVTAASARALYSKGSAFRDLIGSVVTTLRRHCPCAANAEVTPPLCATQLRAPAVFDDST